MAKADRRLVEARVAVRDFRDKAEMVDPGRSVEVDINLQAHQRERPATLQAQYNSISKSAPNSPQLRHLGVEIAAIEGIIRDQQAGMTQGRKAVPEKSGHSTITALMGGYEALKLEEAFREKLYLFALQFAEQSRIEAMRQKLYLNAFVKPKRRRRRCIRAACASSPSSLSSASSPGDWDLSPTTPSAIISDEFQR